MGDTDMQLGGGYVYQWECAMLLALNCFFEPVRDEPLYKLVAGFLGDVAEIHLEGSIPLPGGDCHQVVELEDINLTAGQRRMLLQVKTKEKAWGIWTPADEILLKALYRFYDSPFLTGRPDSTRFVFLTNRQFNEDLLTIQAAIDEDTLDRCPQVANLFASLTKYAARKKKPSVDGGRFRKMLARTTLVQYLQEHHLKASVQLALQAYGRRDWEQAYALLLKISPVSPHARAGVWSPVHPSPTSLARGYRPRISAKGS